MPKDVTASDLLTRVRRRIDRPIDDGFISDTEIYNEIETSYCDLWDLCARKGMPLEEKEQSVAGVTGTREYEMPADFLYPIGVEYALDSETRADLRSIESHERNKFTRQAQSPSSAYRLYTDSSGDVQMVLYPPPKSGDTYYMLYVPVCPDVSSSTAIRGINGWEEWMVNDVAVRLKIKEGLDPAPCMGVRDKIQRERLENSDQRRQGPPTVSRVNSDHTSDAADWYPSIRWGY